MNVHRIARRAAGLLALIFVLPSYAQTVGRGAPIGSAARAYVSHGHPVNAVSAFTVDPVSGALRAVPQSAFPAEDRAPFALATTSFNHMQGAKE